MNAPISPRSRHVLYSGPAHLALADWRRQINALYACVRRLGASRESWMHWHQTRSLLFRHHPMSPQAEAQREGLGEIEVFEYDPSLRLEVETTRTDSPPEHVDLGADGVLQRRAIARTVGLEHRLGGELTLYWIDGYGGGLFLPFKDATSGAETYGGGRYLLDTIKGADLGQTREGRLILDFNFAYNPSCALSDAWTCPLAPAENTLPRRVAGGETLPAAT